MIVNVVPQFTCIALSLLMASVSGAVQAKGRPVSSRPAVGSMGEQATRSSGKHLSPDDTIADLVKHPAFAGFGHLLLPWDDRTPDHSMRLRNIGSLLPYHSDVDPATVVGALNRMIDDVNNGTTVFHEFYTEEEKKQQPTRLNTGLFFFRGKPGAPFAIVSPGGGFSYVASVHEGFPYAVAISKQGYNAFVLRYRVGSGAMRRRATLLRLSRTCSETRRRLRSAPRATPCGAVRLEHRWPLRSVRTASRGLKATLFRSHRQW